MKSLLGRLGPLFIIIFWILWVAFYIINIRPYILWLFFVYSKVSSFPIFVHLIIMFGIPIFVFYLIYYIWKMVRYIF
jgi:hypothetical protein